MSYLVPYPHPLLRGRDGVTERPSGGISTWALEQRQRKLLKVDNDLAGLTWYRIVQLPIQPHGLISWSNFAQTPLHVVVTVVPVYGRE